MPSRELSAEDFPKLPQTSCCRPGEKYGKVTFQRCPRLLHLSSECFAPQPASLEYGFSANLGVPRAYRGPRGKTAGLLSSSFRDSHRYPRYVLGKSQVA